jgi:hypothetical protein
MQNSFDTSFIPQQPLLRVEGAPRRQEPVNFALMLAFVLFFVSLITAGGIYFYKSQIDARIAASTEELAALEKTLDVDEIEKYKRVDARIVMGRALLRDHGVFTIVLDFLEETTAKNIGLTSLNYSLNSENKVEVRLTGEGPSFQSVYFQSEEWKRATPLTEKVKIDSISLDDTTGVVVFNALIVLNSPLLKYEKLLEIEKSMNSATSSIGGTEVNSQMP